MAQLHPTFTNVLVLLDQKEERTAGGIILPEISRTQKPNESIMGEVCGIGPDVPSHLPLGVRVVVPAHKGTEYHAQGRQYVILKAADVLAVVEP